MSALYVIKMELYPEPSNEATRLELRKRFTGRLQFEWHLIPLLGPLSDAELARKLNGLLFTDADDALKVDVRVSDDVRRADGSATFSASSWNGSGDLHESDGQVELTRSSGENVYWEFDVGASTARMRVKTERQTIQLPLVGSLNIKVDPVAGHVNIPIIT